jgi:hypothetical protein
LTKLSPQGIILVGFFYVEDAEKLCNYNILPEFNNLGYFNRSGNAGIDRKGLSQGKTWRRDENDNG